MLALRVCAVLVLAPLAGHLLGFLRVVRQALEARAGGVVLEPPGLSEALLAQPEPSITEEQRQELERDGVVKLSGVVNASVLRDMEHLVWDHAQELNLLPPPWYFNGAIRALVRDGPLAALAAAALGRPKIISGDMQVWANKGFGGDPNQADRVWASKGFGGDPNQADRVQRYHVDERWALNHSTAPADMLTAWLALTDAPRALAFVRGTHRQSKEVYAKCGDPGPDGRGIRFGWLNKTCIEEALAPNLTKQLGHAALWKASAAPGDVFLFYSNLVHAGISQRDRRTAICIRLRGGPYTKRHTGRCLREAAFDRDAVMQLHPRSPDVDCLPWVMLPELGTNSPVLPHATGAAGGARYWLTLYDLYVRGKARFITRNPILSLPRYRDLPSVGVSR